MLYNARAKLMPHPLLPHPDVWVWASVQRHDSDLTLAYSIHGRDVDDIRLPKRHADPYGERRDGLWKTTCFEVFIGVLDDPSYCELNISPSGDWACYVFDHYRVGMRDGPDVDGNCSDIHVSRNDIGIGVKSTYDLSALPHLFDKGTIWRLGVSAVIEENSGRLSYWALAHPQEKPDFHDPACFAIELPPVERP